jgi:PAS domain S-box-containing protein
LNHKSGDGGPERAAWPRWKQTPARTPAGDTVNQDENALPISQSHSISALGEGELPFQTLANSIPQLSWIADENGDIFWYNQRWYEFTGTDLEEMRGWGWQKVHHPDHIESVVARWSSALREQTPWEDTFPLLGKDGKYGWFLWCAGLAPTPIFPANAKLPPIWNRAALAKPRFWNRRSIASSSLTTKTASSNGIRHRRKPLVILARWRLGSCWPT